MGDLIEHLPSLDYYHSHLDRPALSSDLLGGLKLGVGRSERMWGFRIWEL